MKKDDLDVARSGNEDGNAIGKYINKDKHGKEQISEEAGEKMTV